MVLQMAQMVLPVLVMLLLGAFCNRAQIFNAAGLAGLKALIGDICLPVVLFNAFFTARYNLSVLLVFCVVFLGFCLSLGLGFLLRRFVSPYGKFMPFLLASAEGGMLGYALYGLLVGNQTGFATVDLGQTVFAYTVWLGALSAADGRKPTLGGLLRNMLTNKCCVGMLLGILLGVLGVGSWVLGSAAGGIVSGVIGTITAPTSAVVLLTVGYELNLKKELLAPVLKTVLLRLVLMGGLLAVSSMVIFSIVPFDRSLQLALMVLYALPAPFVIPIFANVGPDGEYISTTLSVHTLCTVALYAAIVAYSLA